MNNQSTYSLLMRSEEKSRNVIEIVLYVLFTLSAIVTIWQFAHQSSLLPSNQFRTTGDGCIEELVVR